MAGSTLVGAGSLWADRTFLNRRMILSPYVGKVDRWRGEGELKISHGIRNDLRDRKITKPLVI